MAFISRVPNDRQRRSEDNDTSLLENDYFPV
jgi:hypothetical protein